MEPAAPLPPGPAGPPAPRKRRWLLIGCGGILALLLLIVATVAITLWWMQRPIKPVVLTSAEKAAVDAKLRVLSAAEERPGASPAATASPPRANRPAIAEEPAGKNVPNAAPATGGEPDRPYTPGSKTLRLTERELNGLLNANTDLGQKVRIELGRDAINAYIAVPIPEDFPVGGGKMFRARGRFSLSLGNDKSPYAILEDITVFGLSLPKAWLAGIKGENLLGQVMGESGSAKSLPGVKSLRVEPGALVLEVED